MSASSRTMLLAFAFTLFTSATLLFLVQPMVGKMILPLLGGTPEVWNTCMVFFQAMLLVGYGYAHLTTRWFGVRRQAIVHLVVLGLPLLLFLVAGPLAINKSFIVGGAHPVPGVLMVLLVCVGLPFFVVSTTSPLLQTWFSSTDHPAARDPYFLSTASNCGSMLALIAYPVLVEPFMRLSGQRLGWAGGYGLYIALTAACAFLLWKSGKASAKIMEMSPEREKAPVPRAVVSAGITEARYEKVQAGKQSSRNRPRKAERIVQEPTAPPPPEKETALTGTVTIGRRFRWVLLAFVPSSLLMAVTTYMTTDITAMPLLWIPPLALYLLSFILVFSKISERVQSIVVFVLAVLSLGLVFAVIAPMLENKWVGWQMLALAVWLTLTGASFLILILRDSGLIHKVMILAMPLIVLLLVFIMLAPEVKIEIGPRIALHLMLMFVVAMVCHGEMVRDRPPARYLTEFYMLMSLGGVLGGVFVALIAPIAFNTLAEYPLTLVLACLLLPPLALGTADHEAGPLIRYVDLTLMTVFLIAGGVLMELRRRDHDLPFERLADGRWVWPLVTLLFTLAIGVFVILFSRKKRLDRLFDFVLPLSLCFLMVGLIWGTSSDVGYGGIGSLSRVVPLGVSQVRTIMTFGLPAVLCYLFVERSIRFGLGVGALLLAGTFTNTLIDTTIYSTRSWFGVLKVEVKEDSFVADGADGKRYRVTLGNHRLVHGTTLHGKQYIKDMELVPLLAGATVGLAAQLDPLAETAILATVDTWDYTKQALTYYHRYGPMGSVMRAYNLSAADRIGVIGLGTGSLAAYGRAGQRFVFYDIDKTVKEISFDNRKYFSFVCDARGRGVDLDLVLGDARLEIERFVAAHPDQPDDEKYAVLAVDAFSSDAIPIHLITREAVELFFKTVRQDDGIVAYHISNRYLDLRPVLANIAQELHLAAYYETDGDGDDTIGNIGKSASTWVVLARKEKDVDRLFRKEQWETERRDAQKALLPLLVLPTNGFGIGTHAWALHNMMGDYARRESEGSEPTKDSRFRFLDAPWQPLETNPSVGVWTDDYSNLLRVFMW